MDSPSSDELVFVLLIMVMVILFCLAVVAMYTRQWYRERRYRGGNVNPRG